jgi:hypothetical protein
MFNPVMLTQFMRNPQVMQNPMARNTINMLQQGDSKGLEQLARNLCAERGINPDDALKQIKSQFGM